MIKAFTMDMDGMLVSWRDKFKEQITPKHISDEIRDQTLALWKEMKQFKKWEINEDQYRNFVRDKFSITITNEGISNLFKGTYQLNEELITKAKKARKLWYLVCVITNNFPTRFETIKKKFDLENILDILIASYQVKVMKPDQKIFKELIKQTWLKPKEIAYADDNEAKLQWAKDLGIHTFTFKNNNDYFAHLKKLGINLD